MNWSQFRAILWLRWRLSSNQLRRSGSFAKVLTLVVSIATGLLAVAGGVGGVLLGANLGRDLAPEIPMLVWDALTVGFLFFWTVGLMTELQRSESIDLPRLMHLPVSLRQVFVFNYLASHVTLSLLLTVPAMLGLALGQIWARGGWMWLLPPVVLAFLLMITAWTYCLRGWLAALMANQRRRRTIIVAIAMGTMLLGQLPNLYFNVLRPADRPRAHRGAKPEEIAKEKEQRKADEARLLATVERVHPYVPLLWLPDAARHLAAGRPLPAILEGAGCALLAMLGLRRAYRATLRYYQGQTGQSALVPRAVAAGVTTPRPARRPGGRLVAARLGGVPEHAAAVALATFRSLSRAPEVKMAVGVPLVATLVLGILFFGRVKADLPEAAKPFIASSVVGILWVFLFQFFSNQFGYDRQSFRTLVLTGADRKLILLGKNLAAVPVVFGMGITLLVAGTILARLPVVDSLAAVFQLVTLLVVLSLAGNCVSILAPYRIQAGSMRAAKMPIKAVLLSLAGLGLLPLLLVPIYMAPLAGLIWQLAGGPALVPVNLVLSMFLAGLAVLLYWAVLAPLGRFLQSREIQILETVTSEIE